MKTKHTVYATTLALGLILLSLSPGKALASTITFTGEITATSCTVTGAGNASGVGDITITLPKVGKADLDVANSVAGYTPFQLVLGGTEGCTDGQTAAMWVESGATTDLNPATNNLRNHQASGSNAEVQLINPANGKQILLGVNEAVQNGTTVVTSSNQPAAIIADNTATLSYVAQYQNAGAKSSVTAGKVESTLVYSIQYN